MRRRALAALIAVLFIAGASATVARQDHAGHDGERGAATATATTSATDGQPDADRFEPAAAIRSLTADEIGQIERGEGAGFALPAELNGVPGPRHVLDLAGELDLTVEQGAAIEEIFAAMRADAVAAGVGYLTAVGDLEAGLRDGTIAAADLPAQVVEVKRREGELVAAHLAAHLATAALLTPEQIATYGELRGYGG